MYWLLFKILWPRQLTEEFIQAFCSRGLGHGQEAQLHAQAGAGC